MYKNEYPVWALRKGKKLFVEFVDKGVPLTIPDKDVTCTDDFYIFRDENQAQFFLEEYEGRLKGFSVVGLRVTKTFSILEISQEESKKLDREWIKKRLENLS
jgi:hypothetical protein